MNIVISAIRSICLLRFFEKESQWMKHLWTRGLRSLSVYIVIVRLCIRPFMGCHQQSRSYNTWVTFLNHKYPVHLNHRSDQIEDLQSTWTRNEHLLSRSGAANDKLANKLIDCGRPSSSIHCIHTYMHVLVSWDGLAMSPVKYFWIQIYTARDLRS